MMWSNICYTPSLIHVQTARLGSFHLVSASQRTLCYTPHSANHRCKFSADCTMFVSGPFFELTKGFVTWCRRL
eukprot:scaffold3681_cov125-Skeletonema_dohrnii-CCMP3373.AAC.2